MTKISKKKLFVMLLSTFFVLSAVSAEAQILLWETTTQNIEYATEISSVSGLNLLSTGVKIYTKFGFGANQGDERYIRFDLSSDAKFKVAPSLTVGTYDTTTDTYTSRDTGTLSQGGINQSYVIFNYTSAAAATAITDVVELDITNSVAGTGGITIYNTNTITITYKQYKFPSEAISQSNPIASASGTLVKFSPALDIRFTPANPDKIDVTQESKFFDDSMGDKVSEIGDVNINVLALAPKWYSTNLATTLDDIVADGTKLIISGDFSATQDLTNGAPDGTYTPANVFIDGNGDCIRDADIIPATALNAESATFNLYNTTISSATTVNGTPAIPAAKICMEVNGVSIINKTYFTGLYDITNQADSNAADVVLGTESNPLSELKKNGSQARINFLLTPDSMYKTYVRVTNPSGMNGYVFLTLTNDAGKYVTFNLSSIAEVSSIMLSGKMKSRTSTPLLGMDKILAAAQAKDSTFTAGDGKLRLDAEAEFGTETEPLDFPGTGVVITAFSMMTDGTGFVMMPY